MRAALARRLREWRDCFRCVPPQRLHRCGPAREGLGGTALAMREGSRQRQRSARLRRQLRYNGPRKLRLYARKGSGGAQRRRGTGQGRTVTMSVLHRRRSWQLDWCSTARKGLCGPTQARAARRPAAAAQSDARHRAAAALRERAAAVRLSSFIMVLFSIASFGLISASSQAFWASTRCV